MRNPGEISFNGLMYLFYLAGFLMVGGGFVLYTSGADLNVAQQSTAGSLISQAVLAAFYLGATLLLASSRSFPEILRQSWPLLLLPALAIASIAWSSDPALTLRRAIAFAGTVLFGLSLGSAYDLRDAVNLAVRGLALAMLASIAVVFLDPYYGVHQSWEAIQAEHAGSWRGIFAHRNTLGLWSGVTLAFLLIAGPQSLFNRALWIVGLIAAFACLALSGSSAGIAVALLLVLFHLGLLATIRQPPHLRGAAGLLAVSVMAVLLLLSDEIARVGLELLGRQSDLSGRTWIWYYIVQYVEAMDQPLGLGYFVGSIEMEQHISALTQTRVVNAHNGYLEAFVYFGWPGLILCLALLAWLARRSIAFATEIGGSDQRLATVPAAIVFLAAIHNVVESTIVAPNNLNTLLLSFAAGLAARHALENAPAIRAPDLDGSRHTRPA
ncbi:MAG: O-antigen ligase family protein [Nitratireductor sp.]|nr:O-antigen ligase family protein [Nitratireductor sp.]